LCENAISMPIKDVYGMVKMDPEAFVREMFEADSTIRYVGIVSTEYKILASKQREGVASLVPEEARRNFVSIVPQIIIEAVEKMSPFLGQVVGVTAHYRKALMVFYRIENLIVVISFLPDQVTPFYDKITETFKRISAKHLA
jgi:hypothetical protein